MHLQIQKFIENNKDALYSILKDLCLIPAPSGSEERRAAYCLNWLKENGAQDAYMDDALNVIFPWCIEGSKNITVFAAHTDTVFPDTEPMPYEEKDGKVFCPGVGDDTAHVAILLLTAKFFIQNNIKPDNGFLFVFNSCEEGLGNLKGVRKLMDQYSGRVGRFVTYDALLGVLHDECVGSHRYEVEVTTRGGHSFQDFGIPNAIAELSALISKIYRITPPQDGNSRTTYNVGIVSGGTSVNTIAQSASMLCEYRSNSYRCLDIMKQEFEKIFAKGNREGVRVQVKQIGDRPCANIDDALQKAFCDRCANVVANVLGGDVLFKPASTDCNIPLSLGIPSVCIGLYEGGGAHTREEWLVKDSLLKGLEVALQVGMDLLTL